jgi:hypothetical protein
VYDKTVFKPQEIDRLGRYSFTVVDSGESSEEPDAEGTSAEGGSDSSSEDSSETDASDPPSQFDLGDFSDMKPADDAGAGDQDELPMLGGPDSDK